MSGQDATRRFQTDLDAQRREVDSTTRELRGGPGQGRQSQNWDELDQVLMSGALAVAAAVGVLGVLVLVAGHVSTAFFGGGLPRYPPEEAPGVVLRFVTHPGDPAAAWEPVNSGTQVPGAEAWWATLILLAALIGFGAMLVVKARSAPAQRIVRSKRGDFAKRSQQHRLRVPDGEEGRLVVGTSGRSKLGVEPLHSLLVVGPSHSGKTSGLAIPALLEWRGPAVVASRRGHLIDETIGWRSHHGDVHVFDPGAATRYNRSGWVLLYDCGTWQGSIRMAQHLTAAAKASFGGRIDGGSPTAIESGALWTSAMAMSLAPYLFAGAADGRSIMEVAQWIEREERDEVLELLQPLDGTAARAHETTFFREDPARSTFFHFVYEVLSVYGDPTVAETAVRHEIVTDELLDGGSHTLYLTTPEQDQVRFQPLFATIVRQLLTTTNDRFASRGRPLHPPLLLLLDEAVGIASLEELAAVASSGATKGVQVVSIFEDLGRYDGLLDDAAGLLAKSHRAKLVLPDQGGRVAGRPGETSGSGGEGANQRLLPPEFDGKLGDSEGVLLDGNGAPVKLRLRRWYRDGELRRRVETEQDVVMPRERRQRVVTSPSPVDGEPDYSLMGQISAWDRRKGHSWPDRTGSYDPQEGGVDGHNPDPPDNVTPLNDARDRPHR